MDKILVNIQYLKSLNLDALITIIFKDSSTIYTLTAPNLIWLGVVSLLFIFFYNLIRFSCATLRIGKELSQHSKILCKSKKQNPLLTGDVLEDLEKDFQKSKLLSHCWSEFRETFISEVKEGQSLIFNTRAANEFFSKEAVCESNLKVHLYNALPSVLTGVGLLFTFLAILLGLGGVVIDGQIKQEGMIHLVESLSGKFLTSIFALALATLFILIEKTIFYKVEENYKELLKQIDSRFPRRSTEYLLEKIVSSSIEQADQLRHFSTDLSGRLKQGLTESFQPILERLTQAIDKLESERSTTMSGMANEFKSAMTQSADGEIQKLGAVVGSTAEVLRLSNEQSQISQKKMDELISQMDSSQQRQAESTTSVIERLTGTVEQISLSMKESSDSSTKIMAEKMSELMTQMDSNQKNQTEATAGVLERLAGTVDQMSLRMKESSESSASKMTERMTELLTNLEASSHRTLEESRKQTDSLSQIVDSMSQRVEGALNIASGVMTGKITELLSNLEQASQRTLEESKKQNEVLSQQVYAMSQRVEAVLNLASGTMTQTIGGLVSQSSQLSEATTTKLSALFDRQSEGAELLKSASDMVGNALMQFQELVRGNSETYQLYGEATKELRQVSTIILDDLKLTRSVQLDISTVSSSLKQAGENLQALQSQNKEVLSEYERVFLSLDTQIGSIIEKLHDNTQRYNETAREAIVSNLKSFDNALGSATTILGQTVGELTEGLEDLSEIVTRVIKKD